MDKTTTIFMLVLGVATLAWGLFELITGQAYTRTTWNMFSDGDRWADRGRDPGRYWTYTCMHLLCGSIICGIALAFRSGWID